MEWEIGLKKGSNINELVKVVKASGASSLCLTDKPLHLANLVLARNLKNELPNIDLTVNFSITNQYQGNPVKTWERFKSYLDEAKSIGISRILLVSGNPKRQFDSVEALEYYSWYLLCQAENYSVHGIELSCAFNPYLSGQELIQEQERLSKKIATGMVKRVYMQIGDNPNSVIKAVEFIKVLEPKVPIYGALLIPTQSVLNSFKLRPWHGVKLSQEYLENIDQATNKTKALLQVYNDYQITPLIELLPLNQHNLNLFTDNYAF